MESASDPRARRYRRRVIGVVALAMVLLGVLGAAIAVSDGGSDRSSSVAGTSASAVPDGSSTSTISPEPASSPPVEPATAATEPASTGDPITADVAPTGDLPSLSEVIVETPSFSTFEQLLDDAEMWEQINAAAAVERLTVFAPTDGAFDRAFERLGADSYAELFEAGTLRAVLGAHLVKPELMSGELRAGTLSTIGGGEILVAVEPAITLTSALITASLGAATDTNIQTTSGVVHAIDEVLIPDALDVPAAEPPPDLTATFDAGVLAISGSVSSSDEERLLRDAARASVHPDNVRFQLADDATGSTEDGVERMSSLLLVMGRNLASGTATLNADELVLVGIELDPDRGERLTSLAGDLGATVALGQRPVADEPAAQQLREAIDETVVAEPIRFMSGGISLEPAASPTLERIAAQVRALDGIVLTVVGHTDSDGSAASNLALSAARSAAVRDALIVGGVDPAVILVEGRGEAEPVLDVESGAEDKDASRRIEFVVRLATPVEVDAG